MYFYTYLQNVVLFYYFLIKRKNREIYIKNRVIEDWTVGEFQQGM